MSIKDKIKNANKTDWVTRGMPKWRVRLIVFFTKLKCRFYLNKDLWRQHMRGFKWIGTATNKKNRTIKR